MYRQRQITSGRRAVRHNDSVPWEILRSLDEAQQRAVLQTAVRRRFRNGDTLFHQGDPGESVHLLDRGHVAVKVSDTRGTTVTLELLGPGAAFGEQALVDPAAVRFASTVAMGAVETLMIRRADFADLQKRHPAVTQVLVEILTAQVRRLSEQLLDAYTMGAEQRVVKKLQSLANGFRVGDGAVLPMTQEELASLAGTTRPTANRALQSLVDAGTIQLGRGRILIADVEKLNAG